VPPRGRSLRVRSQGGSWERECATNQGPPWGHIIPRVFPRVPGFANHESHEVSLLGQLGSPVSSSAQSSPDGVLLQKLEYMHNNPVKRGYVDEPVHWRYSSARNYAWQLIEARTEW